MSFRKFIPVLLDAVTITFSIAILVLHIIQLVENED